MNTKIKENIKHYYGSTKKEIEEKMKNGQIFLVLDVNGMQAIKKLYQNVISIFIDISVDDIKKQLVERGGNENNIEHRFSLYSKEIKYKKLYDFVVLNEYNKIENTLDEIAKIIKKQN